MSSETLPNKGLSSEDLKIGNCFYFRQLYTTPELRHKADKVANIVQNITKHFKNQIIIFLLHETVVDHLATHLMVMIQMHVLSANMF